MSSVRENELKNLKNDLKNSLENLESELEYALDVDRDCVAYDNRWQNRIEELRDKIIEKKALLVIIEMLLAKPYPIKMEFDSQSTGNKVPQSYWTIAVNWEKNPTINASDYTFIEGVGAVEI